MNLWYWNFDVPVYEADVKIFVKNKVGDFE